jgi:hypothetical protein
VLYWFGFDESIDTDSRVLCLDDLRPDECALLACMGPPPPLARESYGASGRGGGTAGAGSSGGVGVGRGGAGPPGAGLTGRSLRACGGMFIGA